jgi:hypothetical protein
MFSPRFNVDEAFFNITTKVDYIFFTESIKEDLKKLPTAHDLSEFIEVIGSSAVKKNDIDLSDEDLSLLKDRLEPEIELYDRIKEWAKSR